MNFRDCIGLIRLELKDLYPETEIDAFSGIIFSHLFGLSRYDIVVQAANSVPEKSEKQIYDIIQQLKRFIPIQYILGETEFYSLKFLVNSAVLIPRPETEELVDWIIKDSSVKTSLRILDIGTGSGCIAVSLAKNINNSQVSAIDISEDAISVATKNATLNQTSVNFCNYDILNYTGAETWEFDIIVSNPPYVTPAEKEMMMPNVLQNEPSVALFTPENDPLLFYRIISRFAYKYLSPGGLLYFEINEKMGNNTVKVLNENGFEAEIRKDINQKDRMIKAWRNG